jgi:hypothetical protein
LTYVRHAASILNDSWVVFRIYAWRKTQALVKGRVVKYLLEYVILII